MGLVRLRKLATVNVLLLFMTPTLFASEMLDVPAGIPAPEFHLVHVKPLLSGSPWIAKLHPHNSRLLFTSEMNGYVRLSDLCTGEILWSYLRPHLPTYLPFMVVSPTGKYVITADAVDKVYLLDGQTGILLNAINLREGPTRYSAGHAAFSADERVIYVSHGDDIKEIDVNTGQVLRLFKGRFYGSDAFGLGVTSDKNLFAITQQSGLLRWQSTDPANPIFRSEIDVGQATPMRDTLVFGDRYVSMTQSWGIEAFYLVNIDTATAAQQFIGQGDPSDIELTADLRWVFSSAYGSTFNIWETRTGKMLRSYATVGTTGDEEAIGALAIDPSGQMVAVGLASGAVGIYSVGDFYQHEICGF